MSSANSSFEFLENGREVQMDLGIDTLKLPSIDSFIT